MPRSLRPSVILGTILASIGVIVCILVVAEMVGHSRKSPSVRGDAIAAAVHAYVRDKERVEAPLPPNVPLRELVAGGYLREEDVAGIGRGNSDRDLASK
jgi:hypothetical protein